MVNCSSWEAWSEPAKALATSSPRFAIMRFESHFKSSFFLMIFSISLSVLVTGSVRPQRILPENVMAGR